ncbi:MAG: hypothetical protein RIQ84_757 [Pseudomonadota bacterium]|jgi:uncharacterized protein
MRFFGSSFNFVDKLLGLGTALIYAFGMNSNKTTPYILPNNPKDLQSIDLKSGTTYLGQGALDLSSFPRLSQEMASDSNLKPSQVHWEISTWFEERLGGIPLQYMHLRLAVDLPLSCQACFQAYVESIDSDRDYILFDTEEEAENWDLDEENQDAEDALVASETFNLLDTIEDELLLSLPLSARHALGECKAEDLEKVSKKLKTGSEEIIIQKPNPFAILQKLKKQ